MMAGQEPVRERMLIGYCRSRCRSL